MAAPKYDPNSLWVALSELGEGNVFSVYPTLLAQLLLEEEDSKVDGDTSEVEKLILPSDKDWRLQKYFYLVGLQKTLDESDTRKPPNADEVVEEWAPWKYAASLSSYKVYPPVIVQAAVGRPWDIKHVAKAASLLCKPQRDTIFLDEPEMRHVYSIIYDVFRLHVTSHTPSDRLSEEVTQSLFLGSMENNESSRFHHKSILDQVLEDIQFFTDFPELTEHDQIVWLFVLELARRGWKARSKNEADEVALLFNAVGAPVREVEQTVWRHRIHLAAAIARIRIKHGAFSIAELLPAHLRDEKLASCINKEYLTGWVNIFKVKKMAMLIQRLHDLGYSYTKSKNLMSKEYSFDRVCPRFMTIRPAENESIGQLDIVKNGLIVLQEREFCEGAANLCRILRGSALRGAVAQTHASSPRCSAYLAAQLKELAAVVKSSTPSAPVTPQLGKLVVFGAGDNLENYVKTLRNLGVEASAATGTTHKDTSCYVWVLSEPVDSNEAVVTSALDGVVAALATPPNSYSAVTDPIDLVCGRGGDLAMLEILTESEIDDKSRTRVQSILEEQKKTLKALLSKPQIQIILYETHSCLAAENQAQVARAVAEANRLARERHLFLKKRHRETVYAANVKVMDAKEASMLLTQGTQMEKDDEIVIDATIDPQDVDMTSSTPNTGRTVDSILTKQSDDSGKKRTRRSSTKAWPIPEMGAKGSERIPKDPDQDWADVSVPNCDLFEVRNLPNIGNGLDINQILEREGCYLSLIQRKEVTSLDAKYMIRMAEERGLFGSAGPAPSVRPKNIKETLSKQRRPRASGFKVGRISAPTQASLARALKQLDGSIELGGPTELLCPRCQRRGAAASALCAAACTCDQRHKHMLQTSKSAKPGSAPAASQQCRRPYPLTVHDVRLRVLSSRQTRLHFIESIL